MFENVYDDGRTTDGRRLDGYTISSPCEPNGSGELKMLEMCHYSFVLLFFCEYHTYLFLLFLNSYFS